MWKQTRRTEATTQPPSEWERERPGTHGSQQHPHGFSTRLQGHLDGCPPDQPRRSPLEARDARPWHAPPVAREVGLSAHGRQPSAQPAACTWSAASPASPVTQFGAGSSPARSAGQLGSRVSCAAAPGIGRVASGHVSRVGHRGPGRGLSQDLLDPAPRSLGAHAGQPLTQHRDGFNPHRCHPPAQSWHSRT